MWASSLDVEGSMRFVLDSKKIRPCEPNLFGLFFEDINHSLDGLLNANLVQNGWFDFSYFTYGEPKVVCENDFARFWELGDGAVVDTKQTKLACGSR